MSSDDDAPEGAKKFSDLENSIRSELNILRSKKNEYKETERITYKNIGVLIKDFCEDDHKNFLLQYDNYVDIIKQTMISQTTKESYLFSKYEMICLDDEIARTAVIKNKMEKIGLNWEEHGKVVVTDCMLIRRQGLRDVKYFIDQFLKHAFAKVPVFCCIKVQLC